MAKGCALAVTLALSLCTCAACAAAPPRRAAAASRRAALSRAAAAAAAALLPGAAARAAPPAAGADARAALLAAIAAGAADADVAARVAALVAEDPSRGAAAASPALGGTWRLVWSARAEAFSPLLRLPPPLRPESYQLLGDAAAAEVGAGRVAQLLTRGVLGGGRLWLSSGVAPAAEADVLEIYPPFRLELEAGAARATLVEAASDAEFRAANARAAEAQAAPRNRYQQQYLETTGRAGDLRISTIVSGDPVIVGAVFVHERVI